MPPKRIIEFIAVVIIAIAAFGFGLTLMNVRSTPVVFGGFLVCLFAITVGGFRIWNLTSLLLNSNSKAEEAE